MPPRKKAEDKKPAAASPQKGKPLRKLSTISLGSSASSSTAPSKPALLASSFKGKTGKRKVELIELDSDVEEIVDWSDDDRLSKPTAKARDKGKGKEKAAPVPARPKSKHEKPARDHAAQKKETELWTDVYAPTQLDDLAINKKKLAEVRDWLSEALPSAGTSALAAKISRYRRIITLTGPAGVGKTACIKAVADELDCELVEWAEGFEEWGMGAGDSERESLIARLETFMLRSSFPSLNLPSQAASTSSSAGPSGSKRKILLLDTLPNLAHPETREAFQNLLRQFAQAGEGAPLVIIVSDSGETGRAGEGWGERGKDGGWCWRDILGKEVMALAGVRVVSFNPVPPTALAKALNRILPLAVPVAARRPPKDAVQLIVHSSQGDVRSAVNALQFLCRAQVKQGQGGKAAPAKKATGVGSRGGKPPRGTDKALKSLLDAVTRREQSLVLFHALGKVLWNKRLGDPTQEPGEEEDYSPLPPVMIPLPEHLEMHGRRQSKVDVEVLFKEAPVDTGLFNLYLHQNYPVFCTDIDECAEAVEMLSHSDALKTDDDLWQSSPIAIAYAFNTSVRGLLAALPSPMPHCGQKVYKPDWFAAFREQRANEEAVDEVGRWTAGVGLGMGAAGQMSRKTLTTELIPELRYLEIPPTYPASLPDLAVLDCSSDEFSSSASRSALNPQGILLGTDDVAQDPDDGARMAVEPSLAAAAGSVELLEGQVERQGTATSAAAAMFTARDEAFDLQGVNGGEVDGGGSADEVEGDEIGSFSD